MPFVQKKRYNWSDKNKLKDLHCHFNKYYTNKCVASCCLLSSSFVIECTPRICEMYSSKVHNASRIELVLIACVSY